MENEENVLESTLVNSPSSAVEGSTADEVENSSILAYDYYDRYYDNVLNKLTAIEENQQTIIYNQEQTLLSMKNLSDTVFVTNFLVVLLFLYIFVKSIFGK